MVDSNTVLAGQTIAYTMYVLAIMALMGWFAYRVTKEGEQKEVQTCNLLFICWFSDSHRRVAAHYYL